MTTTPSPLDNARAFRAATNAAERAERSDAQTAVEQARHALYLAEARLNTANRLNTYALQQTAAQNPDEIGRGKHGEARALLAHPAVDTIARRQRVLDIAHTGMNLGIYGRWSSAVSQAATALTRVIEEGREGEQHYAERTAEQARQADQYNREARFDAAVAATFA